MLKIFVDRFRDEEKVKIEETLSPDFLEVEEDELSFKTPVRLHGEAYLASDHIVIKLSIYALANMPCSICNQDAEAAIEIPDWYLTEQLENIKSGVFDYTEHLREAILLELPHFMECLPQGCPEKEALKGYFKPERESEKRDENVHFPFADLDRSFFENKNKT